MTRTTHMVIISTNINEYLLVTREKAASELVFVESNDNAAIRRLK